MSKSVAYDFQRVLADLAGFVNYERTADYPPGPGGLGTERIAVLLRQMDDPQTRFPSIHIAGTKGKGSTAYLTAALLTAYGYKVGLYTSPHIENVRERIQIQGEYITEAAFCRAYDRVRHAASSIAKGGDKAPTYFELLTAMAFLFFAEERVDVAVVEVGLGGRLDATNAPQLRTAVCGFTPISRDHMQRLGNDIVSIAQEKAGILRPGAPVVMAPQAPAVAALLRKEAGLRGCQIYAVGEDVKATLRQPTPRDTPEAPQRLDLRTWRALHHDVPLPLLGEHQIVNAAAALALAEVFVQKRESGPVDTACLRRAWREIHIPGRIEVVSRQPWVIIDGAHNPASAWALAETLCGRFSATKRVFVIAIAADKEVEAILKILLPLASCAIMTTNGTPRSLAPEKLQHLALPYGVETVIEVDPVQALRRAISMAGDGIVCACGSLYLAGILRSFTNSLSVKG